MRWCLTTYFNFVKIMRMQTHQVFDNYILIMISEWGKVSISYDELTVRQHHGTDRISVLGNYSRN